MQLEIGISTMRYFPASGTAGLARSLVNGNSRVPCPPPIMTDSTLLVLTDCRPVCDIIKFLRAKLLKEVIRRPENRQVGLLMVICIPWPSPYRQTSRGQ